MVELRDALLLGVSALHREVDALGLELKERLPHALACGPGCAACCPADLTVLELEAEWIRRAVGEGLRGQTPAPAGCAFLDEAGRCRIYAHRPYVCRTQGLPLRWFEEDEQGEILETRDLCEESAEMLVLDELDATELWLLGPFEARLVELAEAWRTPELRRCDLAGLFRELAGIVG
jgi:Fe-S-cluster containining protein